MHAGSKGGVCANLDYEVDQMTDYVAEMTQRLCLPNIAVSSQFRKFVSQILTSTRLPSTTILLGMNYLSRRANMIRIDSLDWRPTDGQVWRMLTVGLLLGSKFLDDNTFQNRSWSEVSGIAVGELNAMELEWLTKLGWLMYVNIDMSPDFQAWLADWESWRKAKNIQHKATLERLTLAPINTNVQRPHLSQGQQQYNKHNTRDRPQYKMSAALEQYDQQQKQLQEAAIRAAWSNNSYPTPQPTPPSAPDSGFSTPEYPSATGGNPRYHDWSVYQPYSRAYQQPPPRSSYAGPRIASYPTPIHSSYPNCNYDGHAWDNWSLGDASVCMCCSVQAPGKQPYMSHGYIGQQIVA